MRQIINFNDNWTFLKPGETAAPVTLPHTWNAIDGQDGGNDYWRGTATYSKAFAKPELRDGERCFIEFDGMRAAIPPSGPISPMRSKTRICWW